jgi:hypothetical protein
VKGVLCDVAGVPDSEDAAGVPVSSAMVKSFQGCVVPNPIQACVEAFERPPMVAGVGSGCGVDAKVECKSEMREFSASRRMTSIDLSKLP